MGCSCEDGAAAIGCAETAATAEAACSAAGPWPRGTAYVTTAFFGIPVAMGAYALLRKAPRRIPLFAAFWVAISTAVRQVVCCRCAYYGRECSTLMGKWTAGILEPDPDHPLTAEAFYLDFGLIGASLLYPLPQAWKMGRRYLALYALAIAAGGLGMRLLGCRRCPNAVCFMNPRHGQGA